MKNSNQPANMVQQSFPSLLALPPELVYHILAFLPATSLVVLERTCRLLSTYAIDDRLWYHLVQENVPLVKLTSPSPCDSFKELYVAHHPCWFLPRNKLWFSDSPHTGKLIVARYDPRRACIEAYRLVAEHGPHTLEAWDWNQDVLIHDFAPRVQLWLDDPVLKLDIDAVGRGEGRTLGEFPMDTGRAAQGIYSLFFFARPIPPSLQDPSMMLWPPRILPATQRVRNDSRDHFRGSGHKPQTLAEASDTTFRIRKWMEFAHTGQPAIVRMGEDVTTFSTLPEECYAPTREKPWQGIWVGDYSGHGCEFLIVLQSSKKERRSLSRASSTSSSGSYVSAVMELSDPESNGEAEEEVMREDQDDDEDDDEETCSGRLEAIKLTGDPNIPRGEYTWIAEDIGRRGLIRIAEEPIFRGARVVKSMGHVAARFFRNGRPISKLQTEMVMLCWPTLTYW